MSLHSSCMEVPDVVGVAGWTNPLNGPGQYDPNTRTVTIDTVSIDQQPEVATRTLWHEFAHHLDFSCGAQQALTPQFQQAENMDPDAWYRLSDGVWKDSPAEAFAAITAGLITGSSTRESIYTSHEAVVMVADWEGIPAPSWATTEPVVIMLTTTTTTAPPATTTTTTTRPSVTTTTRPPTTTTRPPVTTTTTRPPAPQLKDTLLPPEIMGEIAADGDALGAVSGSTTSTTSTPVTASLHTATDGLSASAAEVPSPATGANPPLSDERFFLLVAGLVLAAGLVAAWMRVAAR